MALLGEESLVRVRRAADTYVAGVLVRAAEATVSFMGSVQPMSGSDRRMLREGGVTRIERGKKIYCAQGTLSAGDHVLGQPADVVRYGGRDYTVVHVDDEHPLIGHDRAYVVEVLEAG
ncbi:MAG: hypothetical protein HOP09_14640 [Hyphomicrobium sp.]|nr:hypothetical protein [Hyphomicrobium sp.]